MSLSYNCTMLNGVNKSGVLKPDEDGYYELILGGFDFDNSAGATYPAEHAKKYFESNSALMRRIKNGYLRSEYGHPKLEPGMSREEFMIRIMTIEETRICAHIKSAEIRLLDPLRTGRKIPCVVGKIKPSGPYGDALKGQLDNPGENVAFSIRSITDDKWIGGKLHKFIEEIYSWDFVVEPGIAIANKYQSPALENMTLDLPVLERTREQMVARNIGTESIQRIDTIINRVSRAPEKKPLTGAKLPTSASW